MTNQASAQDAFLQAPIADRALSLFNGSRDSTKKRKISRRKLSRNGKGRTMCEARAEDEATGHIFES